MVMRSAAPLRKRQRGDIALADLHVVEPGPFQIGARDREHFAAGVDADGAAGPAAEELQDIRPVPVPRSSSVSIGSSPTSFSQAASTWLLAHVQRAQVVPVGRR